MARSHVQGYLRQLHLVDDLSKSICLLIELALEEGEECTKQREEDSRQRIVAAQQLSCQVLQRVQKNLGHITFDLLKTLEEGKQH